MHRFCTQDLSFFETAPSGIRHAILHGVLLGQIDPTLIFPAGDNGPFQVLLLRPCAIGQTMDANALTEQLRICGQAEHLSDLIRIGNDLALLLRGQAAISKFQEFSCQSDQEGSLTRRALRFPEPLFLACGRVTSSVSEIPASYQDALGLLQRSFFSHTDQHLLQMGDLPDRAANPTAISILLLENYTQKLLQSVQAFNRTLTYATLSELEQLLSGSSDTPDAIRLFFADLYLQIKEQMRYLYPGYTIPFYTNTHIIRTILDAPRLNDITCFLAQRFDMIMAYIGASSQESVLGSILHYIQHNFTSNITLESIAPLFGYNHSYLGKIFRKKMGVSFNEYIDRLRIERAKELLLQDDAKVYAVSKQVGYKNVDYFHVKFRKYVDMSPVEFRRANQPASNSPIGENSEKGSLFRQI